jgi:hypothetical protein
MEEKEKKPCVGDECRLICSASSVVVQYTITSSTNHIRETFTLTSTVPYIIPVNHNGFHFILK